MKHSLDELLSVVYQYYPRRMLVEDPGYQDTEEHRRLVQARIQAGAKGNPWRVLLARLSLRLPGKQIQNNSLHLSTGSLDAGYAGLLWLTPRGSHEKNHVLGFLISFLVPYYVVYSSVHVLAPRTDLRGWSRDIHFTFSPDEEASMEIVIEEIVSVFPGYESMPQEIGTVIVPDVVAGNQPMGETSLFQCLFTDAW